MNGYKRVSVEPLVKIGLMKGHVIYFEGQIRRTPRTVKKIHLNPTALRKAKIVYNFGLSECSRVKGYGYNTIFSAILTKGVGDNFYVFLFAF